MLIKSIVLYSFFHKLKLGVWMDLKLKIDNKIIKIENTEKRK